MAYLLGDGFDFYQEATNNSVQLTTLGPWTASYSEVGTTTSKTRFGVGKSAYFRDSPSWIKKSFDSATSNTLYISFAFYLNTALNSSNTFFRIYLYDATATQMTLTFKQDGTIDLRRGEPDNNVVVASFPNAFNAFNWQHFQFKIVVDSVNGSISIRKNGSTTDTYSATGLNNQGSSTSTFVQILIWQGWYYFQTHIDDLFVNDSSGTTCNTWPGDIRCYSLSPSGAGDLTDFTPTPTQANYLNVNETVPNTANYNTAGTVGNTDLFALADLSSAPASINAVVARCVANKSDAGTRTGAVVIKSGTTVATGSDTVLSTTYNGIFQPYTTNPDTGESWTYGTVNSLQIGYKVTG